MASINFSEIRDLLAQRGSKDALPDASSKDGYFIEIRFDTLKKFENYVDKELVNKVITAESAYGSVTIIFDENGLLHSIDVS